MATEIKHGNSGYINRKCRCDICVQAHKAYMHEYKRRKRTARELARQQFERSLDPSISTYRVLVSEVYEKEYTVRAVSESDAISIARTAHMTGDLKFCNKDYAHGEYEVINSTKGE